MASRDYLIRQLEEMGFFLSTLLRRIRKMQEENKQDQMESAVREELSNELKMDLDQIIVLENEEFLSLVKTQFTSDNQLEKLADILFVLGKDIQISFTISRANYLRKALFLFSRMQETSSDFSYERKVKIEEIREIIRIKEIGY